MPCNLELSAGGTAAAVPPPFRPSEPALCGSCPLVTPYYCRLGDLLCFMYVYRYSSLILSMHVCFVLFPLFDLSFVDFPSVLWYCWLGLLTCKNHLPYNLYCVGGDVKHYTINQSIELSASDFGGKTNTDVSTECELDKTDRQGLSAVEMPFGNTLYVRKHLDIFVFLAWCK